MSKSAIWSRMGRWFKPGVRSVETHGESKSTSHGIAVSASVVDRRGWWGRLLPIGGSAAASDASGRVANGRSDGGRTAMNAGGRGLDELARTIDRLSGSVGALPQVTRQQSEVLRTLAGRMEIQAGNLQRLEETLAQVPRMADAHRETMVSVSRKLDSLRETTDRGTTVMNSLQHTLDRIDDASGQANEAVRELDAKMVARDARAAGLLIDHARRMTMMGAVGLLLAGVAAVSGTLALFLR